MYTQVNKSNEEGRWSNWTTVRGMKKYKQKSYPFLTKRGAKNYGKSS